jgi:hypothetical protein
MFTKQLRESYGCGWHTFSVLSVFHTSSDPLLGFPALAAAIKPMMSLVPGYAPSIPIVCMAGGPAITPANRADPAARLVWLDALLGGSLALNPARP